MNALKSNIGLLYFLLRLVRSGKERNCPTHAHDALPLAIMRYLSPCHTPHSTQHTQKLCGPGPGSAHYTGEGVLLLYNITVERSTREKLKDRTTEGKFYGPTGRNYWPASLKSLESSSLG